MRDTLKKFIPIPIFVGIALFAFAGAVVNQYVGTFTGDGTGLSNVTAEVTVGTVTNALGGAPVLTNSISGNAGTVTTLSVGQVTNILGSAPTLTNNISGNAGTVTTITVGQVTNALGGAAYLTNGITGNVVSGAGSNYMATLGIDNLTITTGIVQNAFMNLAGSTNLPAAGGINGTLTNLINSTNASLTSVTNWGSSGHTNYTYTDASGWWNTNTSAANQGVNIAKGTVIAGAYAAVSNLWTINSDFPYGPALNVASGAATLGITGVSGFPTTTVGYGELTILGTGDIVFTNAVGFHASDGLTNRTFYATNSAVNVEIAIKVIPGKSTNMAFSGFWHK